MAFFLDTGSKISEPRKKWTLGIFKSKGPSTKGIYEYEALPDSRETSRGRNLALVVLRDLLPCQANMGNWALSVAIAALLLQVHAQIPDQPLQSSQPQQTYPYPDQPVQSYPAPDQPVQSYPDQPDQTYPAPDQPYATYTAPAQSSPIGSSLGSSDCACIGLDYTNGGAYLLDGNSDDLFVFNSAFEGTYFLPGPGF